MFSLIITIVSIALVVALVAATMYHGGDTLTQGRAKADAAAFVSGAQQVAGASTMFRSLQGQPASDVRALVTEKYLSSIPKVKGDGLVYSTLGPTRIIVSSVDSVDVCEAINRAVGMDEAQASAAAASSSISAGAFGCYTLAFNYRMFFFKI